ncbi:MAG: GNAT family N-acetyltransferase [Acidimicrobiales bacterium]|jgi:ribosomal protein S18 acetylase RimI-like enzyme
MVSIRVATRDDYLVIERFAKLASRSNPPRYFDHWGRWGDFGVIAEADGRSSGAAWARLFAWKDLHDPHGSPDYPEVALAVDAACRGRGIGTALMRELLTQADELGYLAVDLSVDATNLAAMAVYSKLGFKKIAGDAQLWMRATIKNDGAVLAK